MLFTLQRSHKASRIPKMGTGRKDLEIIYNLQWKNISGHGDDKANIVGMYDTPATTLNWETFKSYLLKNSGATGDDVKVSYVSIDDKEFPIESQLDFQIALYSFRQRARNGDIITLKLDRISEQKKTGKRARIVPESHKEDKVKIMEMPKNDVPPQNDAPPEWFKKYMKEFKKEIVDEVTSSVVNYITNTKSASTQVPCHHTRRSRLDTNRRSRKLSVNRDDANSREKALKSLKLERKLDNKLEKYEQKTIKIKEKKLLLMRSADDPRPNIKSRPIGLPSKETEIAMDASVVGQHELTFSHMSGGEICELEWEVINTGNLEWNELTNLRYDWGSEVLKPVEKIVSCPNLKPGETGKVKVQLEIPVKSGNYECYWHFYHDGRRFGHWLGCQVTVDPPLVKTPLTLKDSTLKTLTAPPAHWKLDSKEDKPLNLCVKLEDDNISNMAPYGSYRGMQTLDTIVISDSSSSDSDNQSIVSIADAVSNCSTHSNPIAEFVVVSRPPSVKSDENVKVEVETEQPDSTVVEPEVKPPEMQIKGECGYAYVTIEGEKLVVPKHLLRSDFLATAEDASGPIKKIEISLNSLKEEPQRSILSSQISHTASQTPNVTPPMQVLTPDLTSQYLQNQELALRNSLDLLTGLPNPQPSGFEPMLSSLTEPTAVDKSRLFVFPLNCPGFEVVYPPNSGQESFQSFPAELESIDSNHTAKATDGNASTSCPCEIQSQTSHENSEPEGASYTWMKSETAYACSGNPNHPNLVCHKCEPTKTNTYCYIDNPNDLCGYVRHRTFNHAKHCNGTHCQQPLYSPPAEAETFSQCSNSSMYQQRCPGAPSPEAQPPSPTGDRTNVIHILPNTLVSGAVNVASSAINTARSVINMLSPSLKQDEGQWVNGCWTSVDQDSAREKALRLLQEMGFWDRNLNATLLARYNDDIARVISELVQ